MGLEKGKKVMALMDSDELNRVLSEISKLQDLSPKSQESVWYEFVHKGYEVEMTPGETLFVLRQYFNGSKIR